jgi:hypothetical protein
MFCKLQSICPESGGVGNGTAAKDLEVKMQE